MTVPSTCGGGFLPERGAQPRIYKPESGTRVARPGARGHGTGAGPQTQGGCLRMLVGGVPLSQGGDWCETMAWLLTHALRGGTIPDRPDTVPPGWGLIHTGAGTSEPPGEDNYVLDLPAIHMHAHPTVLGTNGRNGDLPQNAQPAGKAPQEGADPNRTNNSFRNHFVTSAFLSSQPWGKVSPASAHSATPEQNNNEMQSWRG